jgi:hypothetical protein
VSCKSTLTRKIRPCLPHVATVELPSIPSLNMQWFYAEGKDRRGPVDEAQFNQLVATGKIDPNTLVWKAGMPNWQPLRAVPTATTPTAPPLPGHQRCIILGKAFPESQMIQTEHGWVSGEAKDTYYQSLREGLAIPVHVGETNARRDGKKVVVPVANARLPGRCMKTNQPVTAAEQKVKTLYWATPWIWLAFFISLLVVLILYLVLRKKVVLALPISAGADRRASVHNFSGATLLIVGLFVMIYGFINLDTVGVAVAIGALMMLGGLIWSAVKGRAIYISRIHNGEAWLSGAGEEFLASLPPYQ